MKKPQTRRGQQSLHDLESLLEEAQEFKGNCAQGKGNTRQFPKKRKPSMPIHDRGKVIPSVRVSRGEKGERIVIKATRHDTDAIQDMPATNETSTTNEETMENQNLNQEAQAAKAAQEAANAQAATQAAEAAEKEAADKAAAEKEAATEATTEAAKKAAQEKFAAERAERAAARAKVEEENRKEEEAQAAKKAAEAKAAEPTDVKEKPFYRKEKFVSGLKGAAITVGVAAVSYAGYKLFKKLTAKVVGV